VPTRDVSEAFKARYCESTGLISGEKKHARLVAVTTSSALGRSSVYNRLRLNERQIFESIGFTSGWGHFHLSGKIFDELRAYLEFKEDSYADGFEFGSGPNWRIRVIRKALEGLGMDTALARHGLSREVFYARLASNAEAFLRGDNTRALYKGLPTVAEVSTQALNRWVVPRSVRDPSYADWRAASILTSIYGGAAASKAHELTSREAGT
jgi:hypothetical protein